MRLCFPLRIGFFTPRVHLFHKVSAKGGKTRVFRFGAAVSGTVSFVISDLKDAQTKAIEDLDEGEIPIDLL